MRLAVSRALPYGELQMHEVYFKHDGPRLFALRSLAFDLWILVLWTGEDDETIEYLYLALSQDQFNDVRSGHVGLREAFETAGPSSIWRVVERYDTDEPSAVANVLRFQDIPETELPTGSARLKLPTPAVPGS